MWTTFSLYVFLKIQDSQSKPGCLILPTISSILIFQVKKWIIKMQDKKDISTLREKKTDLFGSSFRGDNIQMGVKSNHSPATANQAEI